MVRQREKRERLAIAIVAIPILLGGCTRETPAYVIDPQHAQPIYGERYAADYESSDDRAVTTITVHEGDSLSRIAERCGTDVDEIVRLNDLGDNHEIYPGETLSIPPRDCRDWADVPRPELRPRRDWLARNDGPTPRPRPDHYDPRRYDPPAPPPPSDNDDWEHELSSWWSSGDQSSDTSARFIWPVHGTIIENFGRGRRGERNDGINIATEDGAPIRAAASGIVTYTGNELRDYGNLVLIKHEGGYVTAYAHAGSIRVHRGDHVDKGEVIATAGETGDVDRPQLHFEIRRGTQPLDPARYLANRAS